MKKAAALITSLIMASSLAFTAFAGQWQEDENGRWYRNDDGSWPAGTWQWIDSDGDGTAECYYFYSDGYMAHNNEIEGYYVNPDGQWESSGKVRHKAVGGANSASQSSGQAQASGQGSGQTAEQAYADIYRQYAAQYGETKYESKVSSYSSKSYSEDLRGINFLALYDLDGNGTEELLIGFSVRDAQYDNETYFLDIYTDNGSGPVLCGRIDHAEMWTGGEQSCGIRFMSKDGRTYIVTGSEGTGAGSIYNFYALNNGSVVLANTYDFDEEGTFVNGQKTNLTYDALWSGWSKVAHYDYSGWIYSDYKDPEYSMEQTRALIRNTRNRLGV